MPTRLKIVPDDCGTIKTVSDVSVETGKRDHPGATR